MPQKQPPARTARSSAIRHPPLIGQGMARARLRCKRGARNRLVGRQSQPGYCMLLLRYLPAVHPEGQFPGLGYAMSLAQLIPLAVGFSMFLIVLALGLEATM